MGEEFLTADECRRQDDERWYPDGSGRSKRLSKNRPNNSSKIAAGDE